ncbi:unnamed protein product, partial [Ectocarpus fasciculatus]
FECADSFTWAHVCDTNRRKKYFTACRKPIKHAQTLNVAIHTPRGHSSARATGPSAVVGLSTMVKLIITPWQSQHYKTNTPGDLCREGVEVLDTISPRKSV